MRGEEASRQKAEDRRQNMAYRLKKSQGNWWLAGCAIFLWGQVVYAQDITLQASVDRTRVEVGEVIQLTVAVQADQMSGLPAPEVPTPDGLQVVGSTSSSSTSIRILNGSMTTTRTITYVFSYRARKEGSLVLGPAQITHNGKRIRSAAVRVEVVKNSGRPQTRAAPSSGQSINRSEIREIEENIFLQAIPDKQVVYVGEQVGITYKLFTRYDLRNVQYGHVPTFTGFWTETVFDAQRLNMQRETVDGRVFNVALLKKLALFPTTAGKHTLEQLEVVTEIVSARRPRGLFDFDPFGTRKVTIRSGDVSIEVKALPSGAPRGFSGAVGQFSIRAEARFRFYDPKSNLQTEKKGGLLVGQKTFEYVVIPQRAGQTVLPPFSLAYFDPQNARYQVTKTAPIALWVTPGEQAPEPVAGLRGEEVRALGEDIRYIKPDRTQLVDQSALLYQRGGFWLLQLVPLLGAVGAYAYRRHRERLEGDVAYARRRRSRSEAHNRLSKAKRLMNAGDGAAFHGEIHRSLAQFLADRTNRSAAGLTVDQAVAVLSEHSVADDVITRVQRVFSQCDRARFAPGRVSTEQMQVLCAQTEALIGALEKSI
jgi:hypothetical protein